MIRTILFVIYLVLLLLYSLIYLVYYKILGILGLHEKRKQAVQRWVARWSRSLIKIAGGHVEIEGIEHLNTCENVLFVSNHQSYFDILLLLGFIPKEKAFIAKIETKKVPILRTWMGLIDCIFMDRKDVRQSLQAILKGIEYLQKGHSLVIFPEGTRSKSSKMNSFKNGSMKLATKSNVWIIPITLDGSYKFFEEKNRIQPASVKVIIHPPIDPSRLLEEQRKHLAKDLQMQIEEKIQE